MKRLFGFALSLLLFLPLSVAFAAPFTLSQSIIAETH